MSDMNTTSIMDLPTDPVGGGTIGSGANISFTTNEIIDTSNSNSNTSRVTLDQTTINQIVSGLQEASASGATQLQSRDIPLTTENITQDPQVQPNYIPPPRQHVEDYIKDHEENDEIINNYNQRLNQSDNLDKLYDEIQIPILIAILYFLFQLPIFKKYLYKYFPALFSIDGNINVYGLIFMSILIGLLYYILSKIMIGFTH